MAEEVISHRPGIGAADPALTGAQLHKDQVCGPVVWDAKAPWSATMTSGNGRGPRQAYEGVRLHVGAYV